MWTTFGADSLLRRALRTVAASQVKGVSSKAKVGVARARSEEVKREEAAGLCGKAEQSIRA